MERWHYLSFLKAPQTMHKLKDLERMALEPEKVRAFIHIIENDLGYTLFRSIEQSKLALSDAETAAFRFSDPPVAIEKPATRIQFEAWITRELRKIADCVDRVMRTAGIDNSHIDNVFLTGGTSFVPAVRRIFSDRFGGAKIQMGNEFTSVARGLALLALEGAAD
jgi:hypothetical chaperone protein